MNDDTKESLPVADFHYCREVRLSYGPKKKAEAISGAKAAFDLARKIVSPSADREHFAAAYLDGKNVALGWRIIAIGTVSSCLVHPREVFRPALILGAVSVLVFHNHPSGDRTPSAEDMQVTARLAEAGELLGIRMLDHLILGGTEYYSFADAGRIPTSFARTARRSPR